MGTEDDDDELKENETVFHGCLDDVQIAHVSGRHLFHSAPPIAWRLFEGSAYSKKYGTYFHSN